MEEAEGAEIKKIRPRALLFEFNAALWRLSVFPGGGGLLLAFCCKPSCDFPAIIKAQSPWWKGHNACEVNPCCLCYGWFYLFLFFMLFDYFFFSYSCWHPAFTATLPAFPPTWAELLYLDWRCICISTGAHPGHRWPTYICCRDTQEPLSWYHLPPPTLRSVIYKGQGQGAAVIWWKAPPSGQSCGHKSYKLLESNRNRFLSL